MSSVNGLPPDIRAFVEKLAAEASIVVRQQLMLMNIEIKPDGSPVTSVDLAVEQRIRSLLQETCPQHGIIGEEYPATNPGAHWTWLIDPIDGTRQFAAGLPNYGILIVLCEGVTPRVGVICQPVLGDVYVGISGQGAWRNGRPIQVAKTEELRHAIICFSDPDAFDDATRRGYEALRYRSRWNVYDGGCLSFATLAAGRVGVSVYGPNLDTYDFCALVPVVEEAGGIISDWSGRPLDRESVGPIIASCSRRLHEHALEVIAAAQNN